MFIAQINSVRNFAMKREASFRVVNAKLYTKCLRLDAKPLHIEHIYIVYTPKSYDFSVRLFPYFIPRWLFKFSSTVVNIYIIYFYIILLYFITFIIIHYIIILEQQLVYLTLLRLHS